MWRYLAGAAAGVLLVVAGMTLQAMRSPPPATLAAMPAATGTAAADSDPQSSLPAVPEALPATREQKRFDRYDKDRNGSITRDEYLLSRHKAFAKLDVDGNGTLSFDEWAAKAEAKFAVADKDKSGTLNAAEFATTAVKRKSKPRPNCQPQRQTPPPAADDGKEDDS